MFFCKENVQDAMHEAKILKIRFEIKLYSFNVDTCLLRNCLVP